MDRILGVLALFVCCTLQQKMIVHFEQPCPEGWQPYILAQGRNIIGVGTGIDVNGQSQTFTAGQPGGEYTHKMTIDELVEHNHGNGAFQYLVQMNGQYTTKGSDSTSNEINLGPSQPIVSQGRSQSFKIVSPYIPLYACYVEY